MGTTIAQGLAAAHAVRAQWPKSDVNFSIALAPDNPDGSRGDCANPLHVATPDAAERAAIYRALEKPQWHCAYSNGSVGFSGVLAGVPAYLEIPSVSVRFDDDVQIDADECIETVGVEITARVVFEPLPKPMARIARILDAERGRDLIEDVRKHDKAKHASWFGSGAPRSVEPRSQVSELEAIAIAEARKLTAPTPVAEAVAS